MVELVQFHCIVTLELRDNLSMEARQLTRKDRDKHTNRQKEKYLKFRQSYNQKKRRSDGTKRKSLIYKTATIFVR